MIVDMNMKTKEDMEMKPNTDASGVLAQNSED